MLPSTHYVCMCAQSCPTLCHPMEYSPPGTSFHGILQARILKQVAISSSRGSSRPRDWTWVSSNPCIGRQILYHCIEKEAFVIIWKTWDLKLYFWPKLCQFLLLWVFQFSGRSRSPCLHCVNASLPLVALWLTANHTGNWIWSLLLTFFLFTYFWLHRVCVATCELSLCSE